jgi:hypothetical protein
LYGILIPPVLRSTSLYFHSVGPSIRFLRRRSPECVSVALLHYYVVPTPPEPHSLYSPPSTSSLVRGEAAQPVTWR